MRARLHELPEDDPLFDPEDDRAEYVPESWDDADDVALAVWAEVWPESVNR